MGKPNGNPEDDNARNNLAACVRAMPKRPELSTFEQVAMVVKEKQAARIGGHLVDLFTANTVLQIHAALNPVNQAKMEALPIRKMCLTALRLAS